MSRFGIVLIAIMVATTAVWLVYWFFSRRGGSLSERGVAATGEAAEGGPAGSPDLWPSVARQMAAGWLIVAEGPSSGAHHILVQGTNLVGRGSSCAVRLQDPTISRIHARIVAAGDQFILYDLNSTSGTLVDGRKAQPSVGIHLRDGAVISLGATEVVLKGS